MYPGKWQPTRPSARDAELLTPHAPTCSPVAFDLVHPFHQLFKFHPFFRCVYINGARRTYLPMPTCGTSFIRCLVSSTHAPSIQASSKVSGVDLDGLPGMAGYLLPNKETADRGLGSCHCLRWGAREKRRKVVVDMAQWDWSPYFGKWTNNLPLVSTVLRESP